MTGVCLLRAEVDDSADDCRRMSPPHAARIAELKAGRASTATGSKTGFADGCSYRDGGAVTATSRIRLTDTLPHLVRSAQWCRDGGSRFRAGNVGEEESSFEPGRRNDSLKSFLPSRKFHLPDALPIYPDRLNDA